MNAIAIDSYGGPEVLKLRNLEVPAPGAGELLVRLHAAGVNPVDTYLRSGSQGYSPKLPWCPGMDGAGIVAGLGEGVQGFELGDKVYVRAPLTGTYAEYCLCDPEHLFPLPEGLSFHEGACLGVPYFTAARALFTRGGLKDGEKVLIHGGSGGVGSAALQLMSVRDNEVHATAGSDAGIALIRQNGAEAYRHDTPDHFERLKTSSGNGYDLIVEMLANVNLSVDMKLLNSRGRIVVVGSRGSVEITPRDLMGKESSVLGTTLHAASNEEIRDYASIVAEAAGSGAVKPAVARVLPLHAAADAHDAVINGPHTGNIVLDIDG